MKTYLYLVLAIACVVLAAMGAETFNMAYILIGVSVLLTIVLKTGDNAKDSVDEDYEDFYE